MKISLTHVILISYVSIVSSYANDCTKCGPGKYDRVATSNWPTTNEVSFDITNHLSGWVYTMIRLYEDGK